MKKQNNKKESKLNSKQLKMVNEHTEKTQKMMMNAMDVLKTGDFKKASFLLDISSGMLGKFASDIKELEKEKK
jgi:hypothetical protein